MFSNIIVALSNVLSFYPIYISYFKRDYITTSLLSFVSTTSFISHLIENHKHGMPGIGFSKKMSYIMNRFDVLGCIMVSARLLYLYNSKYNFSLKIIKNNKFKFLLMASPFILGRISEYDKYNTALKTRYIITHSLWHLSIFVSLGKFLNNFIY